MITRQLLGDVYIYLADLQKRCTADRRFRDALIKATNENRPIIVVAHSLGSLVVYNYLQDHIAPGGVAPYRVRRLVTIGSMLSMEQVYQSLMGRMVQPPIPIPPAIGEWVNVRHGLDPLAFSMAKIVGVPPATIPEVLIGGNLTRPHDAATYLADPATARAIAWGWCHGWPASQASAVPAGCADIIEDVK